MSDDDEEEEDRRGRARGRRRMKRKTTRKRRSQKEKEQRREQGQRSDREAVAEDVDTPGNDRDRSGQGCFHLEWIAASVGCGRVAHVGGRSDGVDRVDDERDKDVGAQTARRLLIALQRREAADQDTHGVRKMGWYQEGTRCARQ
eukprot:3552110-Rhodomonas_salina.5